MSQSVSNQRYVLEKPLGSGLYGRVWKAYDTELNRTVAIKQIKPGFAQETSALLHARALAKLDHPNIVKIYQKDTYHFEGETEVSDIVVMEWLNGKSVYDFCQNGVSLVDVVNILRSLSKAIEYMHASETTHYDLHPGNIIIGTDFVKIIDICVADADSHASYSSKTTEMRRLQDLHSVRTVLSFCASKCKETIPNYDQVMGELLRVDDASQLQEIIEKLEAKIDDSFPHVLSDLREDGLNRDAIEVLQQYGELLLESEDNTDPVSNRKLFDRLVSKGMQIDMVLSAIKLLEEVGFIKLPYGVTSDYAMVTLLGFDRYLQAFDPKRQVKMDTVIRAIIQDGATNNNGVVKLTKIPIVMVNHLLDVLVAKNLIEVRKYYRQTTIDNVTQRLINQFIDKK